MNNQPEINSILSGVAGEHLCAAELTRRGYVASLTSKNTKGIDILAANESATRTVAIQVKTSKGGGREWVLRKAAEEEFFDAFFYIFVNLNGLERPDFFIVPSKTVADFAKQYHQQYLSRVGRDG